MKPFAAEILFLDPDDVPGAKAVLAAVGCDLTIDPDAKDPYSDAAFGMVVGASELSENDLGDWLTTILRGHGADLVGWGFGEPWKVGNYSNEDAP
jgi:hypothetical protein